MKRLIQWSIEHHWMVLAFSVLLLAAGLWTARDMPVDVFPDLTAPTVTILTEGHGMAPDEMESLVTFPIESAINGASSVRRVRSATAVGIAVVWVEFDWGTDIFMARQVVAEKLSLVSGTLPPQVERPVLAPISSIIGESVVALRGARSVLIKDVADVREGGALKRGEGSRSGKPAVIVGVQKQPGANTIELTARLDRELDTLQRELPAGMKIDRKIFRQADFIEVAMDNVVKALLNGGLLVVVVVLLFLANLRAAAITLTAMPLSLASAILGLPAFGASINTMTLGGMAIAIGALVDDAIIDVENVVRRVREDRAKGPDRQRTNGGGRRAG